MTLHVITGEILRTVTHRFSILNPAEAEVHFSFYFGHEISDVEFRGRLMGPRCPYSSTVEIAYPLRPLPQTSVQPCSKHMARIIIPEPSLWDPVAPFLYQGPLEVWRRGEPLVQIQASLGLRRFHLGSQGLIWNGQPLSIAAVESAPESEAQACHLRSLGFNTLCVRFDGKPDLAWFDDVADKFGFLVLLKVSNVSALTEVVRSCSRITSCLGWIVPQEIVAAPDAHEQLSEWCDWSDQLLGIEVTSPESFVDFQALRFICCPEHLLPQMEHVEKPKLVYCGERPGDVGQLSVTTLGIIRVLRR